MSNLSTRTVYTKDAAICKIRVNVDMTISESALQQAFVSLKTAMNGTLQLGVRQEYLTRYLALEYGVAGKAATEKALYGTVASEVRIPARKPYQATRYNGEKVNILVYYTRSDEQRVIFQKGTNPIIARYEGLAPLFMVRNLLPELKRKLREIPKRILKQRFGNGAKPVKVSWSKDAALEELYRKEMTTLGEWLQRSVERDTPKGQYSAKRLEQIARWNRNYPLEPRPLGHLAESGYFFEVVRK